MKYENRRSDINFIVCVAEHCNLNCAYCDHFAPLSPPRFADLELYKRDMQRMAELLGDSISYIAIEGGEPLLNPDIELFIEIARRYHKTCAIKILSNGLLLPQMKPSFWACLRNNNTTLKITKYPIEYDYLELERIANNQHVFMEYANDVSCEKTMIHQALDLEGGQNADESFKNCYMTNGICAQLIEGKFFTCNVAANLRIFNGFFNVNLAVEKRDYIDIYAPEVTKDSFFEYISHSIPACRYCRTKQWEGGNKWRASERKMEEWV